MGRIFEGEVGCVGTDKAARDRVCGRSLITAACGPRCRADGTWPFGLVGCCSFSQARFVASPAVVRGKSDITQKQTALQLGKQPSGVTFFRARCA